MTGETSTGTAGDGWRAEQPRDCWPTHIPRPRESAESPNEPGLRRQVALRATDSARSDR